VDYCFCLLKDKSYIFIVETVVDYSALEFIECYKRFISRRGRCEKMFSDNGTPFVGADKELSIDYMYSRGTEWRFMSPAAPHQGGIYEAAVKSMKYHLKRIIGVLTMHYDKFLTVLLQIEAILNHAQFTL